MDSFYKPWLLRKFICIEQTSF